MSYPMVLNEDIKDLTTYQPFEHTLGLLNQYSCAPHFNLVESDIGSSSKSTIAIG